MGKGVKSVLLALCLVGLAGDRTVEGAAEPRSAAGKRVDGGPARAYEAPVLEEALQNQDFRRVLFTAKRLQLVLMSIPPGGEIGEEKHERVEQALFCVAGAGTAVINGVESRFAAGDAVVVPAGTRHNFRNTGKEPLQLYTVYSPPNHIDGRVHHTAADAKADRENAEFGHRAEEP